MPLVLIIPINCNKIKISKVSFNVTNSYMRDTTLNKSAINALAILALSVIVSSVKAEELQCKPMNSSRVDPNQNFTHEIQKLNLDISGEKITVTPVDFRGKTIPIEYSILDSDEWIVTGLSKTFHGVVNEL